MRADVTFSPPADEGRDAYPFPTMLKATPMTRRWLALPPLLALLLSSFLASDSLLAFDDVPPGATTTEAATTAASAEAPALEWTAHFDADYTINSLLMFVCAVLVLFMQSGFAMLEVGLNSQKNTVNILFKNVMDLALGVLLYLFIGFGLMYPGAGTEGMEKWLKFGGSMVTREDTSELNNDTFVTINDDGTTSGKAYSNSADFMFQVAFAATAATIVSGAVAGRMKFSAYLIYTMILTGLIYPISGYWKWGGGALDQWGFADFAGSIVVHAVGGFAALAGAIVLGPRTGRYTSDGKPVPIPGHNLTFAALGVFILWVGWYGFNPGSQLTYYGAANAEATTYIALTTTIAAAAGVTVATVVGWVLFGKPDLTMALNGALAGLVGITANCDQVSQLSALIIGGVAGALVVGGILLLDKLRIDDPVGAFPVHGLCGVWGGLATGIFGTAMPEVGGTTLDRMGYFLVQLKSSVVICSWAFVTMFIVFSILKALNMLRVTPEEELRGLDLSEHGMEAYVHT